MAEAFPVDRASFARQAALLHDRLRRGGVPVADMRAAPALELQFAGAATAAMAPASGRTGVEPLEGPIEARAVAACAPAASGIRFFLDGAQRTLPFVRIGAVPISAVVAAAGVVEREPCAGCAPVPGTVRLRHAWIVPRALPDPDIRRFVADVTAMGMAVVDPLDGEGIANPEAEAADYGRMQERVYRAARRVREGLEREILTSFTPPGSHGDAWLVVDGRLAADRPRTLGLVKQFSEAYLSGDDAALLLSLPEGHRTTAFNPGGRHYGEALEARTLWYLRLWNHDRLDARHALVRVEAPPAVRATAEIDAISGWLLAERTPRATGDERWATLLYPIHLLERVLKRRIDGDTRGWAGR